MARSEKQVLVRYIQNAKLLTWKNWFRSDCFMCRGCLNLLAGDYDLLLIYMQFRRHRVAMLAVTQKNSLTSSSCFGT